MPVIKRKAFAYITHRDARGERLLVFSHPRAPGAGIQVPAGTIDEGEAPEAAVMREAREETGLADLVLVRFLGEHVRDMADFGRDDVHHRYFYHLRCLGEPPDTWQHEERYPSEVNPADTELPLFALFWARLPHDVPALIADHGALLPKLVETLSREGG